MKILIIGGGNMGLTFAKSFLKTHIVTLENLYILNRSEKKDVDQVMGNMKYEPGQYISDMDLIILAVKPQDIGDVFEKIKPFVDGKQVILSIMAGIKMDYIANQLGVDKVIRAMPNLPAQIGVGMTVFTSTETVTRLELLMVQNLLNSTGKTMYHAEEDKIDAATAVSGSGPAYVFYFMNALIEAALQMGFSKSEAELLSYQTFHGAVELFNKNNYSCGDWISKVTSKGGTTEAAFKNLKSSMVDVHFKAAVNQALTRAVELSNL